jgi:predicted dehydrogenase
MGATPTLTAPPHPIRIGLIGYGYAGRVFHAPLIDAVPQATLACIASSRPDAVLANRPNNHVLVDPSDLLKDDTIDLVVVATPNDSHAKWARAALEAGKDVVVEKPFTLTLAEARAICAFAQERGRLLAVFHNRRWDSDFLTVKRAIESGAVGKVAHFESHLDRYRPHVRQRWREAGGPGAGLWYDLAPHLIDQALLLFGRPKAITATLRSLRSGAVADDWVHAVLHYEDASVILHASMLVSGVSPRFIVHGDKGSLIKRKSDQQEAQLLSGVVPGTAEWGRDDDPVIRWDESGMEFNDPSCRGDQRVFYAEIVAAIRGEAPNPIPAPQILAVMAVLEAGIRSSSEGRTVVPEYDAP